MRKEELEKSAKFVVKVLLIIFIIGVITISVIDVYNQNDFCKDNNYSRVSGTFNSFCYKTEGNTIYKREIGKCGNNNYCFVGEDK